MIETAVNQHKWGQRVWDIITTKLRLRRRATILQAPAEISFLSLNRLDTKFKNLRLFKEARRHA